MICETPNFSGIEPTGRSTRLFPLRLRTASGSLVRWPIELRLFDCLSGVHRGYAAGSTALRLKLGPAQTLVMPTVCELASVAPSSLSAETRVRWRRDALAALGVRRMALILFDAALPRPASSDWGVGSPYTDTARDLFRYALELGFNAIQLGPQGAPSRDNPSPYDGTIFSRNPLALDATYMLDGSGPLPLIEPSELDEWLANRPSHVESRVAHDFAFDTSLRLVRVAFERFEQAQSAAARDARRRLAHFRATHAHWLIADGLYPCLCDHYGGRDFTHWPANEAGFSDAMLWRYGASFDSSRPLATPSVWAAQRLTTLSDHFAPQINAHVFAQWLLQEQHEDLHAWANQNGLQLYGDLHVGCSRGDAWHYQSLFLQNYLLGAPPSRTNPSGQPWGYPVLAPTTLHSSALGRGPGEGRDTESRQGNLAWLHGRSKRLFSDYDAVRIDHPHGWVTPWVYRADTGDDLEAVQRGTRLYASPNSSEHPELARYSLVREDQLALELPRYADGRVRDLEERQVEAFGRAFEVFAAQARLHQRPVDEALICELLSTEPHELHHVRRRYGLGRFRVTQKADLMDPSDVYHPAYAAPEDWVLLGNHDTPPIWSVIESWRQTGGLEGRTEALATALAPTPQMHTTLKRMLTDDTFELAHAELAQLFCSPAENVLVSFSDLFGFNQPYNRPGLVDPRNWSQRLPRNAAEAHTRAVRDGKALSIDKALQLALACVSSRGNRVTF